MKKYFVFLVISLFFLVACIDEFDPKLTSDQERLVIEAHITSEVKHQYVYLTYDAAFNSLITNFKNLVIKAKVRIIDNDGNVFDFVDDPIQSTDVRTREGFNYKSIKKFGAEVGKTYQLFVETIDGKKYQSTPEMVPAVPAIDKVNIEFRRNNPPNPHTGDFYVSVDLKDPAETRNFYLWDWYHVTPIQFCREWTRPPRTVTSEGTERLVDECCGPCFETLQCKDCKQLANDRLINGNVLSNKFVAKIPYDTTSNFYMGIRQYSLNEKAYRYWLNVQEQSKNSGGLFDAIPKSLKGNLTSVDNPSEEVLGFFTVSDVFLKTFTINRNLASPKPIPNPKYLPPWIRHPICFPCEETFKRSKTPPSDMII
jgi:hypothetical protein